MSESSSDDLNGVKLSFHEGNRVPLRCPLRTEKGKRSGTGDDVPQNPFVYRVLDATRPGKNIRGLQHQQLGEVLVDLEKLITQNAGCFAPQETNVRVIVR